MINLFLKKSISSNNIYQTFVKERWNSMSKDDKINIKLEVCRDKSSGTLSIMAHFDQNAPNVFKDKDGYVWMPTPEETDFLNEAFHIMPSNSTFTPPHRDEPIPKEITEEEIKPTINEEVDKKEEILPPPTETNEPAVFEVTASDIKENEAAKEVTIPDEPKDLDESTKNEAETEQLPTNEKVIVAADSNAIDAALKKHGSKDESIREVDDEKTIIDKVLSQKKKGKWSKK